MKIGNQKVRIDTVLTLCSAWLSSDDFEALLHLDFLIFLLSTYPHADIAKDTCNARMYAGNTQNVEAYIFMSYAWM